jgi:hypothetical protein
VVRNCSKKQPQRHSAAEPQPNVSSLRPFAYLGALCGEITVNAEPAKVRRGPQRKPSQKKEKEESAYLLHTEDARGYIEEPDFSFKAGSNVKVVAGK